MEVAAAIIYNVQMMATNTITCIASNRVGQHAFVLIDRILRIVEAINFFSAPAWQQRDALHESKEMHDYKRPLPWFLLIPMLICCRVIRVVMSVVAWLLGWQPVTAMSVVLFMQKCRRKVRYMKIKGARNMSDPAMKDMSWIHRFAISFIIWGPVRLFVFFARFFVGDKHTQFNEDNYVKTKRSLKKNKKPTTADSNECNTAELLDKYADEDDNDPMNDPDFDVKSADLVTESEDDDDEEEGELEEENSEPEEDAKVKENGANGGTSRDGENYNQENKHQENHENNAQQPEENHHNEQQQQHHQHHEEHHH